MYLPIYAVNTLRVEVGVPSSWHCAHIANTQYILADFREGFQRAVIMQE